MQSDLQDKTEEGGERVQSLSGLPTIFSPLCVSLAYLAPCTRSLTSSLLNWAIPLRDAGRITEVLWETT